MNFGEKLINFRKQKGMSQEELAEKIDVTRQTISKWELGVSTPDMDSLVKMSNLFGVSVDELVSNNSESKSSGTVSNPEYVGVDAKYVNNNPNTENKGFVQENKSAKKGMNIYLGVIIGIVVISLIFFIIMMVRIFSGWGNTGSGLFKKSTDVINKTYNMMENMEKDYDNLMNENLNNIGNQVNKHENTIEEHIDKQDEFKSKVTNDINDMKKTTSEAEEKAKEVIEKNADKINEALDNADSYFENGEYEKQWNETKSMLQDQLNNYNFNF